LGHTLQYAPKMFFMGIIISIIEKVLYWLQKLKYGDETTKIVSSHTINGVSVLTDSGYQPVTHIHRTKLFETYYLVLDNGDYLYAADDHLVFDSNANEIRIADLSVGDRIITTTGLSRVAVMENVGYRQSMFDATVDHPDHRYYTNNILSHNTIISAIYIVWYVLFHKDRNVMVISQNGDKVKELMDKIGVIIENLPFYMKPGFEVKNVMSMKFDNGCRIHAQTTTSNSGASFTVHLLYMDEFALIDYRYLNKFYRTVYPTISSSEISKVVITSTPRGLNKFYEIYINALNGINFYNPIRIDWYDVPGRDEQWRKNTIADLGSVEDFNQEYGNQFLAGSELLFKSNTSRRMKALNQSFVHKDMSDMLDRWIERMGDSLDDIMDNARPDYYITWYENFDLSKLSDNRYQFVISIDTSEGGGGDFFVANIFQILPMSRREIDSQKIFTKFADFFKAVQVGMFRSNVIDIPNVAALLYYLIVDSFAVEEPEITKTPSSLKRVIEHYSDTDDDEELELSHAVNLNMVLEMNKEGNYFISLLENMEDSRSKFDSEETIVKFYHRIDSVTKRPGLKMTSPNVDQGVKLAKNYIDAGRLVPTEKVSVDESLSMAKNENGKYKSQIGQDDCFDTFRNMALYMYSDEYVDQIEELLPHLPDEFITVVNEKMGISTDDEDIADIADDYGYLLSD